MTDQKFLWWIHERLVNVYGEREMTDYMHHLRHIIADTNPKTETPNVARCDTAPDLLRKKFEAPNGLRNRRDELNDSAFVSNLDSLRAIMEEGQAIKESPAIYFIYQRNTHPHEGLFGTAEECGSWYLHYDGAEFLVKPENDEQTEWRVFFKRNNGQDFERSGHVVEAQSEDEAIDAVRKLGFELANNDASHFFVDRAERGIINYAIAFPLSMETLSRVVASAGGLGEIETVDEDSLRDWLINTPPNEIGAGPILALLDVALEVGEFEARCIGLIGETLASIRAQCNELGVPNDLEMALSTSESGEQLKP